MQKKLTITIDEEVYEGLREFICPRKIGRFIEELVRPHVTKLYPSETYIIVRWKNVKAMADQSTTVSKKRLINKAGKLSKNELEGLERAIMIQLGL